MNEEDDSEHILKNVIHTLSSSLAAASNVFSLLSSLPMNPLKNSDGYQEFTEMIDFGLGNTKKMQLYLNLLMLTSEYCQFHSQLEYACDLEIVENLISEAESMCLLDKTALLSEKNHEEVKYIKIGITDEIKYLLYGSIWAIASSQPESIIISVKGHMQNQACSTIVDYTINASKVKTESLFIDSLVTLPVIISALEKLGCHLHLHWSSGRKK
jgi:hypothetical protein